MRQIVILFTITLGFTGFAYADCFDAVQVGDPGFVVIEKCGEPQRRERDEYARSSSVEVVRGGEVGTQRPVQPLLIERWYYDTSLNAATAISLEDGGVSKKKRLIRKR
ncbi:MAG: DUF2845 domain-containing protein [Pseudomonadota bacterium]